MRLWYAAVAYSFWDAFLMYFFHSHLNTFALLLASAGLKIVQTFHQGDAKRVFWRIKFCIFCLVNEMCVCKRNNNNFLFALFRNENFVTSHSKRRLSKLARLFFSTSETINDAQRISNVGEEFFSREKSEKSIFFYESLSRGRECFLVEIFEREWEFLSALTFSCLNFINYKFHFVFQIQR